MGAGRRAWCGRPPEPVDFGNRSQSGQLTSPSGPRPPRAPTTALFDLLGRRWALRVLWELREDPLSFQALQERCDGMSTSVLSQRLGELRDGGLVEKEQGAYRLSAHGRLLLDRLDWVEDWTRQWAAALGGAVQGRPRSRGG